ncbi:MAG: Crp/Fnr family transcriptional regulator [Proteobacteria bacterium]|nr:Crp/Fnr family transcriptional regulator [Pseudomonadota bacterium]
MNHKKTGPRMPLAGSGLTLRASHPWIAAHLGKGKVRQLLSADERAHLLNIASLVRFKKRQEIYRAGEPVEAIYNVVSGVVKSFSVDPDGGERINTFLFAGDLLGLSEEGRYANSAEAITAVTAYRLPIPKLQRHLHREAELGFHVICKLCQEIREAQRHAFLVSRREALPKIVMFLQMLEQLQASRGEPTNEIHLPMDRTEIGEYVGMSLGAVSRAFRKLAADAVIELRNRQHVKIRNRAAFDELAGMPGGLAEGRRR